jgi:hypothetical protein
MNFCQCGCGIELSNERNKYIFNHHRKGKPSPNKGKKRPEHSKRMSGTNNPMYGKKRLDMLGVLNPAKRDDIRLKIKENNPMKKLENRIKVSISKQGKRRNPFSKQWREKIGNTLRGVKRPIMSERMKGTLNSNWRGGTSCDPYCFIWADEEYKQLIKDRDKNKCLNPCCKNLSTKLVLHHINYIKKDCRPENLITLCNSCNSEANFCRDFFELWYNAIIYRRYKRRRL